MSVTGPAQSAVDWSTLTSQRGCLGPPVIDLITYFYFFNFSFFFFSFFIFAAGPHVSGWACPVSTLIGLTQSTGPTGPLAVALGGARPATSAAGAGATPATKTAAAPRRSWPEPCYGARFRARVGAFERSLDRASSGGGGIAGPGRKRRRRRGPRWWCFGRGRGSR